MAHQKQFKDELEAVTKIESILTQIGIKEFTIIMGRQDGNIGIGVVYEAHEILSVINNALNQFMETYGTQDYKADM